MQALSTLAPISKLLGIQSSIDSLGGSTSRVREPSCTSLGELFVVAVLMTLFCGPNYVQSNIILQLQVLGLRMGSEFRNGYCGFCQG